MGILRGLIGFMFGLAFGGAALVAVAIYVPQIDGAQTPATVEAAVEGTVETTDKPVVAETPPTADQEHAKAAETQPVVVEELPKTVTTEPAVVVEQPETASPDVDVAKVESAQEEPVEEPETATPTIVWQSQKAKDDTSKNKFELPTITADEPEVVINDPAADTNTGISVGKKPSSKIPSIESTPKVGAKVIEIAEPVADGRALELNATTFEAKGRPLLGVILLDVGGKGLSVDKLKKLKAPLTIAIQADAPDASQRALAYSAAGFEVIAMASDDRNAALNQALNSNQVQTALDVIFTNVPNAIGLLDSKLASIQKNSRMAKMITNGFVDTGHGLVTYAKGLNSVDRGARAAGVRTAKVARTLDANSENKAIMVRYLDRVSLEAGRDGAAIILGTTAKSTVATIAVWLLSSKGQSVSVAPASAVLLKH